LCIWGGAHTPTLILPLKGEEFIWFAELSN
jgi:hypothetical protein